MRCERLEGSHAAQVVELEIGQRVGLWQLAEAAYQV